MRTNNGALASYSKVANAETNPIQQIVMLYDGAIKFLRLAAADIEKGDLVAKAEHTDRALDIVNYLRSILDFQNGGDVAPTLDALYGSVSMMILRGSMSLDASTLNQAADYLLPVRDSWATIASTNTETEIQLTISAGYPQRQSISSFR
jgi:flagellar secretion chaperone FliS